MFYSREKNHVQCLDIDTEGADKHSQKKKNNVINKNDK